MALVIESAATVGIPSSIGSSGRPRSGETVHFNGGPLVRLAHTTCRAQVRSMHSYHRSRGWAGIGYHLLICHHGVVLTGRGIRKIGAHAPGANSTHVGIQFMLGGSQTPTAKQLAAFVELLAWLAARGVRTSITGHRDWNSTDCPGEPLYARVRSGDWGGGGESPAPPAFEYWEVGDLKVPTGDPALYRGMTGTPVRRLQEALATWRPGILPEYGADGRFGGETEEAVREFQRVRGISRDGVYGTESAGELRRALTEADPAPVPPPRPPEDPDPAPAPPPDWLEEAIMSLPTLRQGATGPAVGKLQALLAAAGYPPANSFNGRGEPDGRFGAGTAVALGRFQVARRVRNSVTGGRGDQIAGRHTWEALIRD
ncbi:N-acetylmuramoyl-L-alanine amidase [Nocardiopsis sp. NPDC049922]|uniref:peptidoglycan recognition protein family protein n=1 Tax=Nocardiopsis sp. NPDC049922 TaxID=3155157 RepID=UPI0033F59F5B